MTEELLEGWGSAPVFKVGNTVRRRVGPWTPAVHALLQHLEAVGFEGAPRVLGIDDKGREVLTYIEGTEGRNVKLHGDDTLAQVARLIREFHDAVQSFVPPTDAAWNTILTGCSQSGNLPVERSALGHAPRQASIVCHNDLAAYNTIYANDVPFAFIDWDLAAPAPSDWDLARAAFRFVPLYPDEDCRKFGYVPEPRKRRLELFVSSYGKNLDQDFIETIDAVVKQQYGEDPQRPFEKRTLKFIADHKSEWT